nr:hemolysin III family protein [Bacilli bacterium]
YFFIKAHHHFILHNPHVYEADVIIINQNDAAFVFSHRNEFPLLMEYLKTKEGELYVKVDDVDRKQFKANMKIIAGSLIKGWAIPKASCSLIKTMTIKVRDFEQSHQLEFGSLNFIAIIDTPEGVLSYRKIANFERVKALFFDEEKYRTFLGWSQDSNIDFVFQQVSFAASISKKPLIDRIKPSDSELIADLKRGKNLGCLAKATSTVDQLVKINAFYTPTAEELKEALNILNQYWEANKQKRRNLFVDGKEISPLKLYQSKEILLRTPEYRSIERIGSLMIKGERIYISQKVPPTKKFYTVGEEIGNAVTHGLGGLLAIFALILLLIKGLSSQSKVVFWAYLLYGLSAILLFSASTLYHGLPLGGKAKKLFQKFDHMSIYLLIAGTYTPFTLIAIGGNLGITLCSLMWLSALLGLLMNVFWFGKFKIFHLVLYVGLGWMAFFYLKTIIAAIGLYGTLLLLGGGVAYTIGIVFYTLKLFKFTHMIWHLFVILGFVLHFLAIYFYV